MRKEGRKEKRRRESRGGGAVKMRAKLPFPPYRRRGGGKERRWLSSLSLSQKKRGWSYYYCLCIIRERRGRRRGVVIREESQEIRRKSSFCGRFYYSHPPLLCQVMRGRRRYGQLFFHLLPLVSLVQEYSPFLFVRYSRNFCRTNTCREEKGNLVERCGKSNGGRGSTVAVKFFPVFSLSLTDGIRFLCPHPLSPPHWQFEMQRGRKDIGIPLTLFFSGERTTAQFPLQKNKMEVWEGEREKESSFASARMRRILTVLSPFFFLFSNGLGMGSFVGCIDSPRDTPLDLWERGRRGEAVKGLWNEKEGEKGIKIDEQEMANNTQKDPR